MNDTLTVKLRAIATALEGQLSDEQIINAYAADDLLIMEHDDFTTSNAYTIAGDSHLALLLTGRLVEHNITINLDELTAGHLRIMLDCDYCADIWDTLTVGAYLAHARGI